MASGRHRSAILEAVCALEVAVGQFAERPDPEALSWRPGRTVISLASDLNHLGFSRFVRYLLPLVVASSVVTPGEIDRAADAIECRNRLAHGKHLQRSIDAAAARKHVSSLRKVIAGLRGMMRRTDHTAS